MIKEIEIEEDPFKKQILYLEEGKEVGRLDYSVMYERMEIEDIYVSEEQRGKGIGTKLMSYLVSIAIELRVVNITLEVRVSNIYAIKLYHNFGFREVALRKNYYGEEDAILMEKQVM